jgi:riboflavin transporter FmnP
MEQKTLLQTVMENAIFVAEFIGIVAALVVLAYCMEKIAKKKSGSKERILSTRKIAVIGMFSAIAAVLMVLEFPLPFAPSFYGMDFSELPALIGTFAFGPVAGVLIEFCKIVLKILFKPTSTAFVGELANFAVGCSFLLPASCVYLFHKTKKSALIGSIAGTLCMTVFGTAFNAVYLLPKFAQLFGMPLDAIIGMGTAVNPAIDSITTLVVFAVAPLNLLKGGLVSAITMLIYKKISPIIKEGTKKQGR